MPVSRLPFVPFVTRICEDLISVPSLSVRTNTSAGIMTRRPLSWSRKDEPRNLSPTTCQKATNFSVLRFSTSHLSAWRGGRVVAAAGPA